MDISPTKVFPTEDGIRLNRWFLRHYPAVTNGEFHKLCRTGQLRVNAGRVRGNEILHSDDIIRIPAFVMNMEKREPRPVKENSGIKFSLTDLENLRKCIIHDDDDIVVFNKPAGLAVQGGTNIKKSLDKMVSALFPHDIMLLVHRLDKETSGVIVVAKNQRAAQILAAEFAGKTATKEYLALLDGTFSEKIGTIDTFMVKGQILTEEEATGYEKTTGIKPRRAITQFKVLGKLPGVVTWIQFIPKTGRTHQLRLHAAKSLGAPIVGDDIYGETRKLGMENNTLSSMIDGKNLFLFAHKLSFRHPHSGKIITVRAEIPDFMRGVIKFLEFEVPN